MNRAESPPGASPISVAQEALWMMAQLSPRDIAYNEVVWIGKRGPVNPAALRDAFNDLVSRYDAWHSSIELVDGQPMLVRHDPARFALDVVDLSMLDPVTAEARANQLIAETARIPYDLRHSPVLRPRLVRVRADEHRLYVALHHTIFDGISFARAILPDLIEAYDARLCGRDAALPPAASYRDFAQWEQTWIASPRAIRHLAFWREKLQLPPPALNLPRDLRSRQDEIDGGSVPVELPADLMADLRTIAHTAQCTEFHALAAVWAGLLHRMTGAKDISFATPVDLRRRREFETVVGYCVTPLLIRVDVDDDPLVTDLMARMRDELLDGLDHVVPFERIVRDGIGSRGGDDGVSVQTLLVFQPSMAIEESEWSLHALDPGLVDAVGFSKVDLELQLAGRSDGGLRGQLNFSHRLLSREPAERLVALWARTAEQMAANPSARLSDLDLAGPETTAGLTMANATSVRSRPLDVASRLAELAGLQPDAVALSTGEHSLSYAELDRRVRRGREKLAANATMRRGPLMVCLPPSEDQVVAVLSAVSAGIPVAVMDPAQLSGALAEHRLDAMSVVLVADPSGWTAHSGGPCLTTWEGSSEAEGRTPGAERRDGCVLITGPPDRSAVELTAAEVGSLLSGLSQTLALGPSDRVLALADMLVTSPLTGMLLPLMVGARLVLADPAGTRTGADLSRVLRTEQITFMFASVTRWQDLVSTGLRPARGLTALSGGGPLSRELADRLLGSCRAVWHGYWPIAPGVYGTLGRVVATGDVGIGVPTANHRAYVVDLHQRPLADGLAGELLITGPAAACRNQPDSVIAEPGSTNPARRTGDRARWRPDGTLEIMAS